LQTERIIRPAKNVYGSLRLPGDKSISHRYGMLAAFAEGTSRFANFSTGADCASTLSCMEALGAKVRRLEDGQVEVTGVGGRVTPSNKPLDCGNSGSTMRMISGLLAPQEGRFTLVGDESLSRRPMQRIREPLAAMGARLTLTEGHAPLHIDGGPLKAIDYTTPVPSAQVKTCILLAGLQTAGMTTVREAVRTRDHSELALRAFGAKLTRTLDSVSIAGPQTLHSIEASRTGRHFLGSVLPLRGGLVSRLQPGAGRAGPEPHARRAAGRADRSGRSHQCAQSRRAELGTGGHSANIGACRGAGDDRSFWSAVCAIDR
jgi:3-phosphoshikimate 1-carboxyvinyltransferase